MRAVLISAYIVLLVAIAIVGPAHAHDNSAKLADVEERVTQNAELLKNVTQTLTSMYSTLRLHHNDSCEFNGVLYPKGYTVQADCFNQTCRNRGQWRGRKHNGLCCHDPNDTGRRGPMEEEVLYPEGSTLEGDSCNQICTKGEWIADNSSTCCSAMGTWFSSGKNLQISYEGYNLTCNNGQWNGFYYNPVLDFRLTQMPIDLGVKQVIRYNPEIRHHNVIDWHSTNLDDMNLDGINYWVNKLNNAMRRHNPDYLGHYSEVIDCTNDLPEDGEICQFDSTWLGNKCSHAEDWGYAGISGSSPCVILRMQEMAGWTPDVYQSIAELPADMPEDLKDHINWKTDENGGNVPKMVWVHCKCENPAHEEYIHDIEYTPWQGFPAYYFPYLGETDNLYRHLYKEPIVAVRFDAPASNIPINIECKLYAKNIARNRKQQVGVIQIELTKLG